MQYSQRVFREEDESMNARSGFQVSQDASVHYQAHVEHFMTPFVDALVTASVKQGDAVLDVACGTGFATRSAARAVGPSGRVVGSDINGGMIAMARSVQWDAEFEIGWREASALQLPFADDEFDTVTCQQGAQFFPDIPAGITEMARVARRGGCLAAAIWAGIDHSPFFTTEFEMLMRFCDLAPDAVGNTFVEGGESQVSSWFESAGLDGSVIEYLERSVLLPPIGEYVPQHLKALPWSGGFFELSRQEQAVAIAWMDERLSDYRTDGGVELPFRSYLVTTVI